MCRSPQDGQITRIRDLGRVELGSSTYALRSLLITSRPRSANFAAAGSNALETSQTGARHDGAPEEIISGSVDYKIAYDPTVFVRESIQAVGHTFVEALILVVIVVLVFLQTWRRPSFHFWRFPSRWSERFRSCSYSASL